MLSQDLKYLMDSADIKSMPLGFFMIDVFELCLKTSSIKSKSIGKRRSLSTTESDDKMYSYKRRIVNKENKNEHIKNEKKEILYKMTKIKGDKYFKYDITYTLDELQTAYYQMTEKKKRMIWQLNNIKKY